MPSGRKLRSLNLFRGAVRAGARGHIRLLLVLLAAIVIVPQTSMAAPGSGSASILQANTAVAASRHQWTLLYDPSEDFDTTSGGILEIRIPDRWTPPQHADWTKPGYVNYTFPQAVTSITITGQVIRLHLGDGPTKFKSTDYISVLYGVGGPANYAITDSLAPSVGRFQVSSDPQSSGSLDTLSSGSPFVSVVPATPYQIACSPDTLSLVAGVPDTVTIIARDAFGNRAPFAADEELTLWTDRPLGRFENLAGTEIFTVTIPAGVDSASVRFVDTQSTTSNGRIRAIDANGAAPFVGTAAAPVITGPNTPAGTVLLLAASDTLVANGVDSTNVGSAIVHDGYGNVIALGERFTVVGSGVIAVPDGDPLAPGVQWIAGSGGLLSGRARAGTVAGNASVTVTSERGSASGSAPLHLIPGPPVGTIALGASPDSVAADGLATRTVAASGLVDGFANTVADGEPFTVSTTLGAIATADVDPGTPGVQVKASGGAITLEFLGGSQLGTAVVSAASVRGSAVGSTNVRVVPGSVSADSSSVAATSPAVVGAPGSTVTVTLRDSRGHPLPAVPSDSIVVASSGVSIAATALSGATDSSGSISYAAMATATGSATISVTARGVLLAAAPGIQFTHGPLDTLVLTGPASPLTAGTSYPLQIQARDSFGNPMPDRSDLIHPSVAAGAASGLTGSVALSAGTATLNFTPTLAAPLAISVADDSGHVTTYGPVGVSSAASIQVAAPTGATAGQAFDATLTLRDGSGNIALGDTLTVILGSTSSLPDSVTWALGPAAAGTLGSGGPGGATYRFTPSDSGTVSLQVRATKAESIRLQVSAGALPPAESGNVVITAGAGTSLALLSGDGQSGVVNHDLAQPLRVVVRDAFSNLAPGASVVFGVSVGNGSVDVIPGAPADSIAVTDGAGIATCAVAHLGTVAAPGSDRFRARLSGGPAVFFDATAVPDAASTLSITPSALSLTGGGTGTVSVTARDAYANRAPGTWVTIYLGAPTAGALESLGGTSGSGTTQSGSTDATGEVSVRYRASAIAPSEDFIYARGVTIAPVSIHASVSSSTVASLRVLPKSLTWTAGVAESVRVEGRDAQGNLALGDTATVVMASSDAGVTFAPAAGALVNGLFVTLATATVADSLTLGADLAAGGAGAVAGGIVIAPAPPAGPIPIAAGRTVLTADGRSTTTVTFGPVHDPFGNMAPVGTLLTVTADSLFAADASFAPGLQVATGVDDLARAVLTAPMTAGADTVRVQSFSGSAAGSLAVTYLSPPSLATGGGLAPAVVAPGQSVSFALDITNGASSGQVMIGTASVLSFGLGPAAFSASPVASLAIPPGATRTLALGAAGISNALTPGSYAPALRLIGSDATGEPFDFYLPLGGAQVHVAGVTVSAVAASPNPVPLGYGTLALTFRVDNLAAIPATVDAVALAPATLTVNGVSPALPASLGALGSTTVTLSVAVPTSGIPSGSIVSANLATSVSYGLVSINAATQSPLDFQVITAAALVSQAQGTSPPRYLLGRHFGPTARLANTGSAGVTLSQGSTRLILTQGATTFATGLRSNAVVTGGGIADLAFDSLAVPALAPLGRYAASLILQGTESGQAFADTIPLAPDSVDFVEPAILAVSGPILPDRVSAGQSRPLQATISNTGDVPYIFDASTRLVLGAPIPTSLAPATTGLIPARGSLSISFTAEPLGSPLAGPGAAPAQLDLHGTEDGRSRDEALDLGTLAVERPASIAYVAGSTLPDTVRAGQALTLTSSITNVGGSPFVVDPAGTRLRITDGVESAVAFASGAPFSLAPNATASLSFPSVSFPSALASQGYPVQLTVQGTEWGLAESLAVDSPAGEIRVVEPVAAVQVRALGAGAPIQVAADGSTVPLWILELQPLLPPGGSASAHFGSVALTIVADGGPASNPAALVSLMTLRDDQGALVAQAVPGSSGPVVLTLPSPVLLTGAAVAFHVEVALRPDAPATSVALRLAAETDLVVTDDLTQSGVPIRGAGGLPFQALTSAPLTLFVKAHGYPNPFRAGREDVRLSYRLLADASVRVAIYTLLGDLVREFSLASGTQGGARGLNEVPWDGKNGKGETVRPGVYVAQIEGGGVNEWIKVGVLR